MQEVVKGKFPTKQYLRYYLKHVRVSNDLTYKPE
jgi:hypothetical protein